MKVRDVICGLYEVAGQDAVQLEQTLPLSMRADSYHVLLLQALAERFSAGAGEVGDSQARSLSVTKGGLAAQLLEAALEDAFGELSPEDRRRVAKRADDLASQRWGDSVIGRFWEGFATALDGPGAAKGEAA